MSLSMKRMLAILGAIALVLVSWYTLINSATSQSKQYQTYLETARYKGANGMFHDAERQYQAALGMRDTLELQLELAQLYKDYEYTEKYVGQCTVIAREYPHNPQGYEMLVEYYRSKNDYASCQYQFSNANKRGVTSQMLEDAYNEMKYYYNMDGRGYTAVGPYSGGVMAVERNQSQWGYVNAKCSTVLSFDYKTPGLFNPDGLAAVQKADGTFVMIDQTGSVKHVDVEKKPIEACGMLYDGLMAVKYNGKYHYCNADFLDQNLGEYDEASVFFNGFAAVRNGDKWFFIDKSGKAVFDQQFDDIKLDSKGLTFRNGVAFVKKDGKYILINTSGQQVGNTAWDDVRAFESDQPAAVCLNGMWGFVSADGNMVTEYVHYDAQSFVNGFAAVCNDKRWGYIIAEDYSLKIDYKFEKAMSFTEQGTAFVFERDVWSLLKIYSYQ